jgi:hypothetical protein
MTKQQKINRLEKNGYRVTFPMSGNGVIIGKSNLLSRQHYNSINKAYKIVFN